MISTREYLVGLLYEWPGIWVNTWYINARISTPSTPSTLSTPSPKMCDSCELSTSSRRSPTTIGRDYMLYCILILVGDGGLGANGSISCVMDESDILYICGILIKSNRLRYLYIHVLSVFLQHKRHIKSSMKNMKSWYIYSLNFANDFITYHYWSRLDRSMKLYCLRIYELYLLT